MKNTWIVGLVLGLMLSACAPRAPRFTLESYPRVDGSTVTIPLAEALMAKLTGKTVDEVRPYILHSKTHQAYLNLIEGTKDLILVTSPSEGELAYAAEKGVELEVVPVTSEAFVFLVHKDNPVESLTLAQIQDIYTGKITNWSQVGGDDVAIRAFQRPVNSGSQTGFLDLVMDGKTPMDPPMEWITAEMGQLIEAVASYDQSPDAIGYSYYYFVTDMWGNPNVRLLTVNGVYPEPATITNRTYPIKTAYYAVFRKDEPQNSAVRKVVDYVLSVAGQALVEESGYVKVR
jgi:phosphate transport system substrate-binding protein